MKFLPEQIVHDLARWPRPPRIWIAFSGGLDSTILLHALAARREALSAPLAAVHVNHNLHADAAEWARHCREVCARLEIPLEIFAVSIDAAPGTSVEAAARDARYEAFRELLEDDEILLTAQHQDDQFETFLLQALRGAGPHGLAAMPRRSRLGRGWLLRPLLDWPRAALESWARAENLTWLEDPSNADERFDRNYLRRQILPLLKGRWPSAAQTVSRSARHCAEAAELGDELAAADLSSCGAGRTLDIAAVRRLDSPRQRNLLRHWLDWLGFPRPSEKKLESILGDVLPAGPDAEPCVAWSDITLRRYRERLYAEREPAPPRGGAWHGETHELGSGWGRLHRAPAETAGIPTDARIEIRFRDGGERLRPLGRAHHHELKKLFQDAGVPPWRRGAVPLVYAGNTLAAVGDLWLNADIVATPGWRVVWEDRPAIFE